MLTVFFFAEEQQKQWDSKNNISRKTRSPSRACSVLGQLAQGRTAPAPCLWGQCLVPWPLLLRVQLNSTARTAVWSHPHRGLPQWLCHLERIRTCFPCSRNPNGARSATWLVLTVSPPRLRHLLLHPLSPLETVPPVPPICTLVFLPTALPEELV